MLPTFTNDNGEEKRLLCADEQSESTAHVSRIYNNINHLGALRMPLLYLSLAARSLSFPALITPAISILAPKTIYRIVGPRMCTQSNTSWSSAVVTVGGSFRLFLSTRFRTRFMYPSADVRAPLNDRPCFVSTIKSIPTKYLNSGARLASAAFVGAIAETAWWLGIDAADDEKNGWRMETEGEKDAELAGAPGMRTSTGHGRTSWDHGQGGWFCWHSRVAVIKGKASRVRMYIILLIYDAGHPILQ